MKVPADPDKSPLEHEGWQRGPDTGDQFPKLSVEISVWLGMLIGRAENPPGNARLNRSQIYLAGIEWSALAEQELVLDQFNTSNHKVVLVAGCRLSRAKLSRCPHCLCSRAVTTLFDETRIRLRCHFEMDKIKLLYL